MKMGEKIQNTKNSYKNMISTYNVGLNCTFVPSEEFLRVPELKLMPKKQ